MQNSLIIISILLFLYALLLLVPGFAFTFSRRESTKTVIPTTFISIIVPVRNESEAIADCLLSLTHLNYPKDLFEIIIVDDHSTDNTKFIAQKFSDEFGLIKILENLPDAFGKKLALTQGVGYAKGELIVTTDGDCVVPSNWLLEIVAIYREKKVDLIAGPVAYKKSKTVFRDLLEIEQIALQAVSGGSMNLGFPVMCSGANLAYRRDFFIESEGYLNDVVASGDDISLMSKARKRGAKNLHFITCRDAIVETVSAKNLGEAIHQRSRWVSKFSAYPSVSITSTGIVVFLLNFSILVLGILSLCFSGFFIAFILAFLGKMSIDVLLLSLAVPFFREPRLFLMAIPAGIFYPFLVLISSISGLSGKYSWKGRKWKT